MSTTLHVGKKRIVSYAASDGSTIAPGTLSANSSAPAVVGITVDPATNNVTVTGISPRGATVTATAAGYQPEAETFAVAALPTMVPTIGPEV